jgi:cystathionine beta-lyase
LRKELEVSDYLSSTGGPNGNLNDRYAAFDNVVDRRSSDSIKWAFYGEAVLPMWVADMDFTSPAPIVDALQRRISHGIFGYGKDPDELRQTFVARLARLYGWHVALEHIVFIPGLVSGLNVVARAIGEPGSGVLVNTPVYPPFLSASTNQGRNVQVGPLATRTLRDAQGRPYLHYELDFDAMEAAVTPDTRLFMLCNPHNPVGRAYTAQELGQIGEFCLRHDLIISSDEIHCDLLLDGAKHHPIAALAPELAARTITLMAPSKTYNIPGLGCSMVIVPNADVRAQINRAASGIVPHVNVLGMVAANAAYAECEDWLEDLRAYLTGNRDLLFDYVQSRLPQVPLTLPEATYLAWLDFRDLDLRDPQKFFLQEAKVALADGAPFGQGGADFVRLNFGTPRALLQQGLDQIAAALQQVTA